MQFRARLRQSRADILMAGCDPTSFRRCLAGIRRSGAAWKLLVEAGFTPLEAIHIATQNGRGLPWARGRANRPRFAAGKSRRHGGHWRAIPRKNIEGPSRMCNFVFKDRASASIRRNLTQSVQGLSGSTPRLGGENDGWVKNLLRCWPPDEPAGLFRNTGSRGQSDFIIVVDHASARISAALWRIWGCLIPSLSGHIAWDNRRFGAWHDAVAEIIDAPAGGAKLFPV